MTRPFLKKYVINLDYLVRYLHDHIVIEINNIISTNIVTKAALLTKPLEQVSEVIIIILIISLYEPP